MIQVYLHYLSPSWDKLFLQMGSSMNSAIFTESVASGLKNWHHKAKVSLSRGESTSTKNMPDSLLPDTINASVKDEENELSQLSAINYSCNEITKDDVQPAGTRSTPTPEISQEKPKPKIITRGIYDGEISFASTWRKS